MVADLNFFEQTLLEGLRYDIEVGVTISEPEDFTITPLVDLWENFQRLNLNDFIEYLSEDHDIEVQTSDGVIVTLRQEIVEAVRAMSAVESFTDLILKNPFKDL